MPDSITGERELTLDMTYKRLYEFGKLEHKDEGSVTLTVDKELFL